MFEGVLLAVVIVSIELVMVAANSEVWRYSGRARNNPAMPDENGDVRSQSASSSTC